MGWEPPVRIEAEDGHIDLGHDGAKQRRCFKRSESLNPQRTVRVPGTDQGALTTR